LEEGVEDGGAEEGAIAIQIHHILALL
jgi:hypothetical protein